MTERRQRDWSELCTAVANETDSKKLVSLIQELTRALEEVVEKRLFVGGFVNISNPGDEQSQYIVVAQDAERVFQQTPRVEELNHSGT